ncbi:MAG TPA: FHA domain-containing protein [Polyangiaceae bacterium]|nr:FHA domain-containing protein [Polyangiaceae bacterium]
MSSARHARKQTFVQLLHGAPLLLIPVPVDSETGEQDQALLDSLDACTSGSGEPIPPSADGLPFSTATVPGEGERRGSVLARMNGDGVLYAVVLHKRPGSRTISEHRICLGRSHGNDIVLRAPSVSKLHAWFARGEGQQYFVVDAGSHNGTRVREVLLEPKKAMQISSGDVIQFGSVEATFCTPADFWDVLAASPR